VPILKKKEFERRLETVESLIQQVAALGDEGARRSAVEAIQALLDLHGDTLSRMLEMFAQRGEVGETLIQELAEDEMVSGMLLLHGLHPVSLEARVRGALARVRPYLGSHGGNVELLDVTDGVAHLRLQGSCESCPSSTMTIKYAIEREIAQAAPDLVDLVVDGVTPRPAAPAGFIPLAQIKPVPKRSDPASNGIWETVAGLDGLGSNQLQIQTVAGAAVLFCRLGETMFAYQEKCPGCATSLGEGTLQSETLACTGCGRRYDVRHAGRSLDTAGASLSPIPLLEEEGRLKLAAAAVAG
jgi:Fe-S cluster biogenesis protein NfuA/nitrite reductase/ring-hydroxylating ferredoxin subunit